MRTALCSHSHRPLQIILQLLVGAFMLSNVAFAQLRPYVPGEIVVKFTNNTPQSTRDSILNSIPATSRSAIQNFGASKISLSLPNTLVSGQQADSLQDVINYYSGNPFIEYVEPNYLYYTSDLGIAFPPNDPDFNQQWAMGSISAFQAWVTTTDCHST